MTDVVSWLVPNSASPMLAKCSSVRRGAGPQGALRELPVNKGTWPLGQRHLFAVGSALQPVVSTWHTSVGCISGLI